LLAIANFVPSSPILVTVMMEAIRFSETSVLTRTTRRNIPEDGILWSEHAITQNYYRNIISSQRASVARYCYVVPSSPILATLMMEALRSSETSALTGVIGLTSQKTAFFIHSPVLTRFGNWILSLSSGRNYSVGPSRQG
jgi:hypothetical protein